MINVKGLDKKELEELLTSFNLPKYRIKQIFKWIYQKQVYSWEEMTDLPNYLRQTFIEQGFSLGCLKISARAKAADKTVKYLFELDDQSKIESIYLPEPERNTVCFSTQVGCGMGCIFCATGQIGFIRNLTAAEIVDQPLRIIRDTKSKINNLVAMGQGEPFANYQQLLKAIMLINDPDGLGIGARHITISTSGIIPGIKKLAEDKLQVNLAVSLHAADDELRNRLMPINKKYPLRDLLEACQDYIAQTSRRITFEYTLIKGVNDRPVDLKNLIKMLSGLLCHINLIPFNPVPNSDFQRSEPNRIVEFAKELNKAHIETTVRKARGENLAAACGQLQGKWFG